MFQQLRSVCFCVGRWLTAVIYICCSSLDSRWARHCSSNQKGVSSSHQSLGILQQKTMCAWAMRQPVTIVHRHLTSTPWELLALEKLDVNRQSFRYGQKMHCYSCNRLFIVSHPVYLLCCEHCGNLFQKLRTLSRDLSGWTAVVLGARTKLGHHIVIKLLSAGAVVVGTSRYPDRAIEMFSQYAQWAEWQNRLHFYPEPLNLDSSRISDALSQLRNYIASHADCIDILVNSAAQTIRSREREDHASLEKNRYNCNQFVPANSNNSWEMRLVHIDQSEMEEVYRINVTAPTLVIQSFMLLLQSCRHSPYVINVHAREGLFDVVKDDRHLHTNMAKAALAMTTRCLADSGYKTMKREDIWFHGIDPGWFSIDEYHKHNCPLVVPPLDEIDGAARILYPVMAHIQGSFPKTRRHFHEFCL